MAYCVLCGHGVIEGNNKIQIKCSIFQIKIYNIPLTPERNCLKDVSYNIISIIHYSVKIIRRSC